MGNIVFCKFHHCTPQKESEIKKRTVSVLIVLKLTSHKYRFKTINIQQQCLHLLIQSCKKKVIFRKPCSFGQLGVEVDHTNGMHEFKSNEIKETSILESTSTTFLPGVYQLQLTMQNTVLGTAVVCRDSTQWEEHTCAQWPLEAVVNRD